jgi:hypothetical protein
MTPLLTVATAVFDDCHVKVWPATTSSDTFFAMALALMVAPGATVTLDGKTSTCTTRPPGLNGFDVVSLHPARRIARHPAAKAHVIGLLALMASALARMALRLNFTAGPPGVRFPTPSNHSAVKWNQNSAAGGYSTLRLTLR